MDSEKLFNLQLTIQKLEEEVTLYRNGTTSSDLIEIISEKDAELSSLKSLLSEKNEVLGKFQRGTIEVLKQNEFLSTSLQTQQSENQSLGQELSLLKNLYSELQQSTNEKIQNLFKLQNEKEIEVNELNEMIRRLQGQCANIIKDKQEITRQYETKKEEWEDAQERYENEILSLKQESLTLTNNLQTSQQDLEQVQLELQQTLHKLTLTTQQNQQYLADLNDSHNAIQEAKTMITTAQQENELAIKTFHDTDRANKLLITTLQEQINDQKKELEDIQKLHSTRIEEKNQRERDFQQSLLTKDDRIREISYELDVAKRACEELIRQNHKTLQERESHWQGEYEKLERLLENVNQKLKRVEGERDKSLSDRREHDILKAKYVTLEDKIKRQEAYMKSRFLKDKTNTLHVPDAIFKTPSASSAASSASLGGGNERMSIGGSSTSRSSRSHLSTSSSMNSGGSSGVGGGGGMNHEI